jgi:hypothetical protein
MHYTRSCIISAGIVLLAGIGLQGCVVAPPPRMAPAARVEVAFPAPPPLIIPAPPQLVLVPGTSLYVAPDIEGDIVFHQGFWWRPYSGHWYRAHSYRGPWEHIEHERVPPAIIGLPPGFRHQYRDHPRISHEEVERDWERRHHDW